MTLSADGFTRHHRWDAVGQEHLVLLSNRAVHPIVPARATTIQEWFEATADLTPDAVALIDPGSDCSHPAEMTYGELDRRANQLAHFLIERRVGPEVLVAVFLRRSMDAIVAVLGILKAGGAYLPLDPVYPRERLEQIAEDADARLIITQQDLSDLLPQTRPECLFIDTQWQAVSRHTQQNPAVRSSESSLAYVIYTSGSTGRPKGTEVVHRNLLRLFQGTDGWFRFNRSDTWTWFHSLAFDFSVWEIWGALLYGGRLVIVSFEASRTPATFYKLLRVCRVTVLNQTPSAFRQLIQWEEELGAADDLSLKWVIFGGEALELRMLLPWIERHGDENPQLINMYGITETTVHVTYRRIRRDDLESGKSLIGKPIPGWQVYIFDDRREPTTDGDMGELYVGGEGVARGYLKRPELTLARFPPDRFSGGPSARLYRTGDLGRRLASGELEYLGRCDEQVKIRGYRIELGEITHALLEVDCIGQAAVIDRRGQTNLIELVAYLVPSRARKIDPDLVRTALEKKLPDYMIPSGWVILDSLPLTPNGKLDRRALPAPKSELKGFEPPETPEEAEICRIFAEVLGLEAVGRNDHFFRLGGHSLLVMRLLGRLRRRFGGEPTVRIIFEAPTPADLAPRLGNSLSGERAISCQPRTGPIPLSLNQSSLWLLDRIGSGSPEYNVRELLELPEPLNLDALRLALESLVARHEVLRTRFEPGEPEPIQIIERECNVPLQLVELGHLSRDEFHTEVRRVVEREGSVAFDLRSAPLIRLVVLRGPGDRNLLLRITHHIVTDGWSEGILNSELAALYAVFSNGGPNLLPDLPIQYADFSLWQRANLSTERLAQLLPLWREYLADIPQQLELSSDRLHLAGITRAGGELTHRWTAKQLDDLKAVALANDVSLFSALLTLYAEVLRRYAGQDRFIVGSPSAGRLMPELEPLAGFFVNMLPIAVRLQVDAPFSKQIVDMHRHALWALDHQEIPLTKLAEALSEIRRPGISPFFQVTFALQNTRSSEVKSLGMTWKSQEIPSPLVRFDLELHVHTQDGGLLIQWLYRQDCFRRETIAQLAKYFDDLAKAGCAQPNLPLAEHSLLDANAKMRLLQLSHPRPQDSSLATAFELFEMQVRRTPDAVALTDRHTTLTYRQLNIAANHLAHRLIREGIRPGTVIAIWAVRGWELIVGILGILKSGGAYLALDPDLPPERLKATLDLANPHLILRPRIPNQEFPASGLAELEFPFPTDAPSTERNPSNVDRPQKVTCETAAYVVFTSGSTGNPKGVVVPHRGIVRLVRNPNYMQLDSSVRMLQLAPVSFDAATLEIWGPLTNGGLVVMAPPGILSLSEISRCLRHHRVNTLWLTSGLFHAMVDAELESLKGLKQLLAGGDILSTEHVCKFRDAHPGCQLINGYGPTEITTFATCHSIPSTVDANRPVPIGRPINETEVLILDHALNLVPVGMPGEIYLGGTGLAIGYAGAPALTAERFIANPFSPIPGERMYRTGDLGRWQPDGSLEFLGRSDHQMKIRGFRIELGEVESALQQTPGVAQAAVLATTNEGGAIQLAAYIIPSMGCEIELHRIRANIARKLPEYMIPAGWVILNTFPLTPNGKLDRRALPSPHWQPESMEAPRNHDEDEICRLFASVLGLERVGTNNHFFQLGGHSLQAVRLVSAIQKVLGVELPVGSVMRHPTPAEMAKELKVARSRKSEQVSNPGALTTIWFDAVPWSLGDWPSDLPVMGKWFPNIPLEEWLIHHTSTSAKLYFNYLINLPQGTTLLLGGFCRIGLIAFEAACQLAEAGRPPVGIILLDSVPPSRLVRWTRAAAVKVGGMLGASPSQIALAALPYLRYLVRVDSYLTSHGSLIGYLWNRVVNFKTKRLQFGIAKGIGFDETPLRPQGSDDRVSDANVYWQLSDLRERKFAGPVVLLFSQETPPALRKLAVRRWGRLCPNLIIDDTPGNHESCIRADAAGLARKVAHYSRELAAQNKSLPCF